MKQEPLAGVVTSADRSVPRPESTPDPELAAERARELARAKRTAELVAEPIQAGTLRAAAREIGEAALHLGALDAQRKAGAYSARDRLVDAERELAQARRRHAEALGELLGRLYATRQERAGAEDALAHVLALLGVLAEELAGCVVELAQRRPAPAEEERLGELVERARRLAVAGSSRAVLDAEGTGEGLRHA